MQALKDSQANYIQDPLDNNTIKMVVQMGFPVELVVSAYSVVGEDADLIINYIYENYY